jgi:hypothetical protein
MGTCVEERTKGLLGYGAAASLALSSAFLVAASLIHEGKPVITVNPAAHAITRKTEHMTALPYYSNMHTVTTVFNLDNSTETATESDLTTAGITVTETSKTRTSAITPGELADLGSKSPEAAALIKAVHLNVN